ncbi:phage protease [Paenibacillus melissococcoides]|uniref:phage protease n=1 Tax=Paenibacillus melissococcoides TaxID=2912268 RepID=UPI0038B365FF
MITLKKWIVCSGTVTEVQGVPTVIKLLPLGHVKSQKGNFVVDEESFRAMKETFHRRALDIVIDYEHQTLEDVQAPAGGWIKELIIQDNAIAGKVEWTPKAEEYLKNKEYRYLSPVVLVRKSDQKAVVLHSVALTNTPAIDGMFPIINSLDITQYEGGNDMDFLKQLAVLLGLGEEATEEQVLQKLQALQANSTEEKEKEKKDDEEEIVANKTIMTLLGVAEDAKTEDVAAAIMALKNPSGFVPVSEFHALKARLDKKDSDELVMTALKDGKISAAQKAWAEEYALKDPQGFKKFVEKAPQVVPVGELEIEDGKAQSKGIDEMSLKVCKMLDISDEDLEKYGGK